ncbi:hypothetical protein V1478_009038 [Vespula squamosa]|uniref:Uncharacterized protein n=1 Tax=Vespula squamosa TaxID=30214 RepID=A0ABD2AX55_VESSQ
MGERLNRIFFFLEKFQRSRKFVILKAITLEKWCDKKNKKKRKSTFSMILELKDFIYLTTVRLHFINLLTYFINLSYYELRN